MCEPLLFGEFVAESESVVIGAEADDHDAALLFEGDGRFVVVVSDGGRFAPDWFPGLVEAAALGRLQGEVIQQRGAFLSSKPSRLGSTAARPL